MASLPAYAELHCVSNFSFLRGASHPEELVVCAHELGYGALAITDECSLAGVVRAHLAAKEVGLKLLIGTEIRLADGPRLVLLATDREGYGNLSQLITHGRRAAVKGSYRLQRADLEKGLPGCLALLLPDARLQAAEVAWWKARFPEACWLVWERLLGPDDEARLRQVQALGRACGVPLVAAGDVHMHVRARRALQDTLTAIRLGVPVKEAGFAFFANGERHLRPLARLARRNGRYWMAIVPGEFLEFSPEKAAAKARATTPQWPHAFARFKVPAEEFLGEYDSNHIHGVYGDYVEDLVWFCKMAGIEPRVFA
ncbi:MAG: PHP domain-containing protein [Burkholderiales bacterium]|nr:PHP domain-containing protein [Burkholderiales bacterium]